MWGSNQGRRCTQLTALRYRAVNGDKAPSPSGEAYNVTLPEKKNLQNMLAETLSGKNGNPFFSAGISFPVDRASRPRDGYLKRPPLHVFDACVSSSAGQP